jgi:subtilisin family serine protease
MKRRLLPAVVSLAVILSIGLTTDASAGRSSKFGLKPVHVSSIFQGAKSATGRIAKTDRSLLGLSGSRLIPVMVKLDYDPFASYRGGVAGYAATSPEATGKELKVNRAAVGSYANYVRAFESRAISGIKARIPSARVLQTYHAAYGGLAVMVPRDQVGKLLQVRGVAAVQRDALRQPLDDTNTLNFLGAPQAWAGLGGQDHAGNGVLVANIDTGVWPENPMFADNGTNAAPPGTYGCEFGSGDPALGDPFACNDKLIGAYAETDTYMAVIGAAPGEFCNNHTGECSARDADGHGTHTLSTAAGDRVNSAPIFGIDRGPVSGLAPGAWVIGYRVCLELGCFNSDSVASIDQAITDGVDVMNFSISGGANAFTDPVELAFLDFYASGGLVNASAGNSGPGASTADHAGPWTNTIAASYPPSFFLTTLHLTAGNNDTLDVTGSSITPGISSPTPVIFANDVPGRKRGAQCKKPFPPGSVSGMIVICQRGNPEGRVADSYNVMQGGAAGMVLYNAIHQDLFSDNFFVPTVMLDAGTSPAAPHDTAPFLAFMNSHNGVTGTFTTGSPTSVTPDVLTTFSSRGPLGDWIKPNVTAPGIEILAGHSPEHVGLPGGPQGEYYMAIAGTSMSAPQATGVSALVKAAHPGWTSGQVLSALSTSSVQDVMNSDGVTPATPFQTGAGGIRADRAVNPTLTFDVAAAAYQGSATDPLNRVNLNYPSINATEMPGMVVTKRVAKNVSGATQTFNVATTATGGSIKVRPSHFSLGSGGTQTLTITIDGEGLASGQYFGTIKLTPGSAGATPVFMPVAFQKTQGAVHLSHSCTPTTFPAGDSSDCTVTAQNFANDPANVHLEVTSPRPSRLQIQNVSPPGTATADGLEWDGTLSEAIPPPINSITPGEGEGLAGFGYLKLSDFGIPPQAGFGDETLANVSLSNLSYGHELYSQVGIDSNGYLVMGGGDNNDNNCCDITNFPDTARPNNVIAPFWTDLNPGAGGGVFLATDTEDCGAPGPGADDCRYLIIDYEDVPVFGTTRTQSFEVWIQRAPAGHEGITIEYGTLHYPGASTGINEGAENRTGTSGVNLDPFAASDSSYTVNAGFPTPGGSVNITYDAKGVRAGTYTLPARMTSNQTVGTTSKLVTLTVTR